LDATLEMSPQTFVQLDETDLISLHQANTGDKSIVKTSLSESKLGHSMEEELNLLETLSEDTSNMSDVSFISQGPWETEMADVDASEGDNPATNDTTAKFGQRVNSDNQAVTDAEVQGAETADTVKPSRKQKRS
jgi:hypothetical protein